MRLAPAAEGVDYQLSNVGCDLLVVCGRCLHLSAHTFVGLLPVSVERWPCLVGTHLAHACALISAEAPAYAIGGWCNCGQTASIGLLGISSHAGHSQNLLVFLDSLLQLPKKNAQAWESQPKWGGVVVQRP